MANFPDDEADGVPTSQTIPYVGATSQIAKIVAIRAKVESEKITPEQAEVEAEAQGLPRFVRAVSAKDEGQVEKGGFWPFAYAMAWAARKNQDEALQTWMKYRFWGATLFLFDEVLLDAQEKVFIALRSRSLSSLGRKSPTSHLEEIVFSDWLDLRLERFGSHDRFRDDLRKRWFFDVMVDSREVLQLWPEQTAGALSVSRTIADVTTCKAELVRLMALNPHAPVSKAELKKQFPNVSQRGFGRAYTEAAMKAGPAWSAAGRRKRKAAPKA